jgi:xanthine/uracil permease
VTLTIGAGDLALSFAGVTLGGIGTATFGAILLYQLFRESGAPVEEAPLAEEPVAKT